MPDDARRPGLERPRRLPGLDRGAALRDDDLSAVAFDATEPPGKRELGRALAARLASESMSALDGLIMHARRGLDDDPDPSDPAGMPPTR